MILIIYDSVFGNTGRVAGMVKDALVKKGESVELATFDQVSGKDLAAYDLVIFGSPTRAFRPTPNIQSLVRSLKGSLKGKKVACFDTRMDVVEVNNRFLTFMAKHFGYANDFFLKQFKKAKAIPICSPCAFYVKASEGPLKEDSEERVHAWTLLIMTGK